MRVLYVSESKTAGIVLRIDRDGLALHLQITDGKALLFDAGSGDPVQW